MKPYFLLLIFQVFLISCVAQNKTVKMKKSTIISAEKLRNTIWHTGFKRDDRPITQDDKTNYFSDDIYIHFINNDSAAIKYSQYSPSIGEQLTFSTGTYHVINEKEIEFILTEPKGHSVSIGENSIPYHLNMFNNINQTSKWASSVLADFPEIKSYKLVIKKQLNKDAFAALLVLTYQYGYSYEFGEYEFDTKPYIKPTAWGNPKLIK